LSEPAGERQLQDGTEPTLGPVLDFLRLLWAVDHALQSGSKRMESTVGVTGPQRLALRIIGCFPGIAAGRVAEILHVHPSTLTGILRRLESRGLLSRKVDPHDARRALLTLTAKGRKIDALRAGTVESAVHGALQRMPDKIAAAQDMLTALAAELNTLG
jgi:DNA-binding MarR family transcriptional regulator